LIKTSKALAQIVRDNPLLRVKGIDVSKTVKDLVSGSGINFQDHGVHRLKGIPGEWRLFSARS